MTLARRRFLQLASAALATPFISRRARAQSLSVPPRAPDRHHRAGRAGRHDRAPDRAEADGKSGAVVLCREHCRRWRQHRPWRGSARRAGWPYHPRGRRRLRRQSVALCEDPLRSVQGFRADHAWSAHPPTCSRCILRCRRTASASWLRRRGPIPAS